MTMRVTADFKVLERLIQNCQGKPVRIVHDGVEYGAWLELGTTRIAPRPFMTPATEAARPTFEKGWKQLSTLEGAEAFVVKIAQDVVTTIRRSMSGAKHGREYKHGSVTHRASAPGEPPAIDTAALVNSIDVSTAEEFGL